MRMIDADKLIKAGLLNTGFPFAVDTSTYESIYGISIVEAIPIEWLKNKRDELKKEYYDLFYVYTDESRNNQVQLLNDFHAFNTVLKYWEKENETNAEC